MYRYNKYYYYFILIIGGVLLVLTYGVKLHIAIGLYAVFCVLLLYKNKHINNIQSRETFGRLILAAGLLISMVLIRVDSSRFNGFYFIILIADAILYNHKHFAMFYTLFTASGYIWMRYYLSGMPALGEFLSSNSNLLVSRALIVSIIIVFRSFLDVSKTNKKLAESLEAKNDELEATVERLQSYISQVEEAACIKARDSIMQELHNKLGHVLATASIGIQASAILMDRSSEAAKDRLGAIVQQIQEASCYLRKVVRNGNDYAEKVKGGMANKIKSLIKDAEERAGVSVSYTVLDAAEESIELLDDSSQAFLYNVIMEGLTNGILHGGAMKFQLSLYNQDEALCLCLIDNGEGFSVFNPGYGLTMLLKQAGQLGGSIDISGNKGCCLKAVIPITKNTQAEESYGEDTHYSC
jgi:signal transduction histidine kinase